MQRYATEDAEDDEDDEESALAAWRADREQELRADAEARWAQSRRDMEGPLKMH